MKKLDARTIQAGNFRAPSIHSRYCTKELPLVSPPQKNFWPGSLRSDGGKKRCCTGLAERPGGRLRRRHREAGPKKCLNLYCNYVEKYVRV